MDILLILIGVIMILIGFKIFNPFNQNEEAWHQKFGLFFKIGGFLILILGTMTIFLSL